MKTKLYDVKGKVKGDVNLPKAFAGRIRADVLLKVFEAQKGVLMAAYGAKEGAGAQYSASGISIKARHKWKGTYGKGISRIPRKIMSRHGASFNWVGATTANARGGRKPHAPRALKNLFKKINKKEQELALRSGLIGSLDAKAMEKKFGRKVSVGGVFTADILSAKTKDFVAAMRVVFGDENFMKKRSIRAGLGKMRGRKYKTNAGLLFVVGNDEEMRRSGVDVVRVEDLKVSDLAPNGVAGRMVCYSENAIKDLEVQFK
jgi:large subunit ribosomal protein L4e